MTPTPDTLRAEAAAIRFNEHSVVQPNRHMLTLADRLDAAADAWEALETHVSKAGIDWKRWGELLVAEENKNATLIKRLEAAECPDKLTAKALARLIEANKVPSPWRDTGTRLKAFGRWLAALAGEEPERLLPWDEYVKKVRAAKKDAP